eukprot:TRINITY_DN28204_c0_g1_i4.p1 TRINITY_DN28204_c0_g1~~TRINITY_DN28204_c0_g1_i4.p1  ORF type:complete len:541 (+),score=69.67 TRINITY_DN28204_c0_g1_i4:102-1724(+)
MAGDGQTCGLVPALVMGEVRAQRVEMAQLIKRVHQLERKTTYQQFAIECHGRLLGKVASIVFGQREYDMSDDGEQQWKEGGELSEGELRRRDRALRAELLPAMTWVKASTLPTRSASPMPDREAEHLDLADAVPPSTSGTRGADDAAADVAASSEQGESPSPTAERSPSPASVSLTAGWGWASAIPSAGSSAPQPSSPAQPSPLAAWGDPRRDQEEPRQSRSRPGGAAGASAGDGLRCSPGLLDSRTTPPRQCSPTRLAQVPQRTLLERPPGTPRRRSLPGGAASSRAPADGGVGPVVAAVGQADAAEMQQAPDLLQPCGDMDDDEAANKFPRRSPPPLPLCEEEDAGAAPRPYLPEVSRAIAPPSGEPAAVRDGALPRGGAPVQRCWVMPPRSAPAPRRAALPCPARPTAARRRPRSAGWPAPPRNPRGARPSAPPASRPAAAELAPKQPRRSAPASGQRLGRTAISAARLSDAGSHCGTAAPAAPAAARHLSMQSEGDRRPRRGSSRPRAPVRPLPAGDAPERSAAARRSGAGALLRP